MITHELQARSEKHTYTVSAFSPPLPSALPPPPPPLPLLLSHSLSLCLSLSLFLVSFCVLGTLNKYAKMSASMKPPHYTHHPEKSHRDSNTKEHQFFISAVSITKHMKKDACKVILVIATIWLQFFEILWIRTTQFSCSWILDKYCPNQWVWVKFVIDGHVMLVEIKSKIQSLERHYSCIELEKA